MGSLFGTRASSHTHMVTSCTSLKKKYKTHTYQMNHLKKTETYMCHCFWSQEQYYLNKVSATSQTQGAILPSYSNPKIRNISCT